MQVETPISELTDEEIENGLDEVIGNKEESE